MFPFFFSAPTEAYLIFKLLNKSRTGYLNIDEFYGTFYNSNFFSKSCKVAVPNQEYVINIKGYASLR